MIYVDAFIVTCDSEEEKHAIRMACPELFDYMPHSPKGILMLPSISPILPELQARARAVAELYK